MTEGQIFIADCDVESKIYFVFQSDYWGRNKILVLVQGTPPVKAGIWSRLDFMQMHFFVIGSDCESTRSELS